MAARGVNKVILLGRAGGDTETKYLQNGNAVANISLATSDAWKDKQTGEPQERTEWHKVVFFGKIAEIAGKYVTKGSQIYIEGRLQTRKWQDQSGKDCYSTEIVVDQNGTLQLLGSPQGGSQQGNSAPPQRQQGNQAPPPPPAAQRGAPPPPQAQSPQQNMGGLDGYEDDIPF